MATGEWLVDSCMETLRGAGSSRGGRRRGQTGAEAVRPGAGSGRAGVEVGGRDEESRGALGGTKTDGVPRHRTGAYGKTALRATRARHLDLSP